MNKASAMSTEWLRSTLEHYEVPLVRYAARLLGDVESARDVVQDTFLRLCREDPARVRDRAAAWLFTVCRNRAMDVRKRRRPALSLDAEGVGETPADDPGPAVQLEHKEQIREIMDALNDLPGNQQEVIRLKFQQGLSYREISEVTRLSVSNVGFLIHVGLKAVRSRVLARSFPRERALRRAK
jgi:RNA polymerase sigma-70 factor (ECF subfamily)